MKLLSKACVARLWIMLSFTVLSMVSVSAVSFAVSIGQRYQGGIVFYVDESRQHGLIAATRDLPGQYDWQGAKDAADRFVDGGFSDWYLPGKWEQNELYKHKSAVGGFSDYFYWSSTEYSAGYAWAQDFGFGDQYYGYKSFGGCVRAVRAF
ncbi:MAG: DUF1566 domain-containing protein [Chlorobium sp.]